MKKKLKKGNKVVMHSCEESYEEKNYGRIWTCASDEFTLGVGEWRYVYLEGYPYGNNGDFFVEHLHYVDLEK
jgi:hypothetical protein